MQRNIGRIQIEHDLFGLRREALHIQIQKQLVERLRSVVYLLITARYSRAEFQGIQRAFARQVLLLILIASQQAQHRILLELFLIVEILIVEREGNMRRRNISATLCSTRR